jgi:hypothetical protein
MKGYAYHIGIKGQLLDTFYSESKARLALNRLLDLFSLDQLTIEVEPVPASFLALMEDAA